MHAAWSVKITHLTGAGKNVILNGTRVRSCLRVPRSAARVRVLRWRPPQHAAVDYEVLLQGLYAHHGAQRLAARTR